VGGTWLRSQVNYKGANKRVKIYIGGSLTLQISCRMLTEHESHNRIASQLVSCISTHRHLFYFARFLCRVNPKNSKQKLATKDFAWFSNHFPLLTMVPLNPMFIDIYGSILN